FKKCSLPFNSWSCIGLLGPRQEVAPYHGRLLRNERHLLPPLGSRRSRSIRQTGARYPNDIHPRQSGSAVRANGRRDPTLPGSRGRTDTTRVRRRRWLLIATHYNFVGHYAGKRVILRATWNTLIITST